MDDMAEACIHVMELSSSEYMSQTSDRLSHLNVGTGTDVTIREVAELIGQVVGYQGRIGFDTSKPDGAPRKWLDVSRLGNLGWTASVGLMDGLIETYHSYCRSERQGGLQVSARALDSKSRQDRLRFEERLVEHDPVYGSLPAIFLQ